MGVVQTNHLADDCDEVRHLKDTVLGSIGNVHTETLIDFIASNAAIVKTLEVKEHSFNHLTSVVNRR